MFSHDAFAPLVIIGVLTLLTIIFLWRWLAASQPERAPFLEIQQRSAEAEDALSVKPETQDPDHGFLGECEAHYGISFVGTHARGLQDPSIVLKEPGALLVARVPDPSPEETLRQTDPHSCKPCDSRPLLDFYVTILAKDGSEESIHGGLDVLCLARACSRCWRVYYKLPASGSFARMPSYARAAIAAFSSREAVTLHQVFDALRHEREKEARTSG